MFSSVKLQYNNFKDTVCSEQNYFAPKFIFELFTVAIEAATLFEIVI